MTSGDTSFSVKAVHVGKEHDSLPILDSSSTIKASISREEPY